MKHHKHSFARFMEDPTISMSLLVFGLIALLLSVLEFAKIMLYYPY